MSFLVSFAVVRGPAVVGLEHRVAGAGIYLWAVAAVEAEHVGGRGAAVNGDDEQVASAGW